MKRPYAPKCYTDYLSVHPDDDHPIEAMNWADHLNVVAHIEAERDTLQAQLTTANLLLATAAQCLLDAHMEARLQCRIVDHLNPPKE